MCELEHPLYKHKFLCSISVAYDADSGRTTNNISASYRVIRPSGDNSESRLHSSYRVIFLVFLFRY